MMKLNPDIIPHNKFHKGLWVKSNDCPWFFFLETDRTYEIPKSLKFYDTVDDDLKNLVNILHSKNIPTTPSCSGHIKTKQHYSKMYDSIEKVGDKIKNDGVIFRNPETSRSFFYQKNKFTLPWSKYEFLDNMEDYQKKGVIGFVNKFNIYDKLKNEINFDKDNDIILIYSKGNDENEISKKWNKITSIIKKII